MAAEVAVERGDGPAQAVLRANKEQQSLRQAIETQEELQKIKDRVCVTLSAYEIGEELREKSQNNVEDVKNAFVKDEAELEFVDDMANLYLILSDPIAKRKYQQKVTIFVVGYENLCDNRNKLLSQLQDFFNQSAQDQSSLVLDAPEFDFDEVGRNVQEALDKAEKTTERLTSVSQEVMKIFELVNPKDNKRGRKKLEKALFQSQQDVLTLTEKLVGLQTDLEDARSKLESLTKQLETKEVDIERLKRQVNTNKSFATQCDDLKKALEAKEQQLQNYVTQLEEMELALTQAEGKCDSFVENHKNLKEENEKLLAELEAKSKEHQQTIIDTRKDLEQRYDGQVKEIKDSHEEVILKLKHVHEDEVKNYRDRIDTLRKSSGMGRSNLTTPASRDSAVTRYSETTTEYSATRSSMKHTARMVKTVTDMKTSASSRLDTASSEVSVNQERDSALESANTTLFVSMSNTPATPKTAETSRHDEAMGTRTSIQATTDTSTQTDIILDEELMIDDDIDVKSKHELEEFELELSKTPSDELPEKMEEYKEKFTQVQKELEEEILQWKLRFNTKSQALNQLYSTHEHELMGKQRILEALSEAQEQQAQAEKEAEEAILQMEELRAETEQDVDQDSEDVVRSSEEVLTENRSTATSASLLRPENEVMKEDRLQSPGEMFEQHSVAVQCPSASHTRGPALVTSRAAEQHSGASGEETGGEDVEVQPSDSGFEGSGNISPPKSPSVEDLASQTSDKDSLPRPTRTPSPNVRSRLVRSALKDHSVVLETIKTHEMISEFRLNITYWLEQNGLSTDLLTTLPDVSFDKNDELDVLKNIPLIREETKQILEALWQVTSGEPVDVTDNGLHGDETGEIPRVNSVCDVYDVDTMSSPDGRLLSTSPVAQQLKTPEVKSLGIASGTNFRARSVQTGSFLPSPRTTPKGYTQLLHEYNNLNERHMRLEQDHEHSVKIFQEESSQNAVVMSEMQETINNLKRQLLEYGPMSGQDARSSVMFTRLDAERNVKSMKRALHARRMSQSSFECVVKQMNLYVDLPGRRLAELVRRYQHHCVMRDVEENMYPGAREITPQVYTIQERMEELQKHRAQRWSEKMNELSKRRAQLSTEITSSLNEIEESSGIFLIKPLYSYASRPHPVPKQSHPIICKRRPEILIKHNNSSNNVPAQHGYPTEHNNTSNGFENISGRPTWNFMDSVVSGPATPFDNITIPRLLAMDVNRITLSRNPVSVFMKPKSTDHNVTLTTGVREYITVERPIGGVMATSQRLNIGEHNAPVTATTTTGQSLVLTQRTQSPSGGGSSLAHHYYSPLPPISPPNMASRLLHPSATSHTTHKSASSLSTVSFDETFTKYAVDK